MTAWLDLVRSNVRSSTAYHIPQPPGIRVRLDANESPYPLPEALVGELARELAQLPLHRYPDGAAADLRELIGARFGVPPHSTLLGNGSDELIALVVATFAQPRLGREAAGIAFPSPSFVVYRNAAWAHGCRPVEIPLDEDFGLDEGRLRETVRREAPNVIFFAWPNNPTGTLWSPDIIRRCARENPDLIVVCDEAYADYSGATLLGEVPNTQNLVVMRTFSKIGLAGIRLGWLTADERLVAEVDKVRPPYNVSALTQRLAGSLLRRAPESLTAHVPIVLAERARVADTLARVPGVRVYDSAANFLLFRIDGDGAAARLWARLAAAGVLIRNLDRPGPLAGCLRVTIGTPAENDAFLEALST